MTTLSHKEKSEKHQEDVQVTRPFEGVKILDFTQVLAGPYASYQLALLGADVIKVERREGEDMRRTPLSREWADRGLAPGWQAVNGNKRSLTLDLQKPEAITIVKQLAAQADVVMENFRPGVMDKLGIGYAALSSINPRLIYCAISGFGQTGPERSGAGYDGKIQAMSGIMSITGHAETGPTRAGFAVCDVLSGATAAFGVSSALFQRTHTGKGQMIDVSMLEATLAFLSGQVADYSVAGHRQQLSGNQAVSRRPTANLFKSGDGYLLLAVNSEKQYRALMTALGRADALEDPRFVDWFARQENEPALRAIIEEALAKKDPREWEKILEAAGAPCASIWKVEEVIDHPQIVARRAVQEIDTPYGRLRFAGSGFQLAHGGGRLDRWRPRSAPTPRRCWPRSAMIRWRSRPCARVRSSSGSRGGASRPCPVLGGPAHGDPAPRRFNRSGSPSKRRLARSIKGQIMPAYRSRTTTHGRNMAGARGLWRATGMKNEDFGKPIIAVVNSFTQFVPGHVHLKDLGQLVAREIEKAGGVAKEFNTIAVDDGIAMGHDGMLYSLPSREIIADSVEYMADAHCADAMVCISNCDKITPGMLMAALGSTSRPCSSRAGR